MDNKIDLNDIPSYVSHVTSVLEKAGFEAYLVGGCVRDLLMKRTPKDFDITTNAKPEEIISLFEKTVYENDFGTVGVCISNELYEETKENAVNYTSDNVTHETGKTSYILENNGKSEVSHETKYHIVEVTPYRKESRYSDFRHPDSVSFSDKIEDDLKRRDFTINALAFRPHKGHFVDLYKGQDDIKDKMIKTVGNPDDRFTEDALRILRAVRFSTELDFVISHETTTSIINNAHLIKNISIERIRDEFIKIIMSPNSFLGIELLHRLGLLKYIIPELEEGIGCEQKGGHIYDVWNHLLYALKHATDKNFSFEVRMAALFHDIGKPRTRRWDGSKAGGKGKHTFYGHEVVGERMVIKILERLKLPKKQSLLIVSLVRNHMFFSDTETITLSAVRRVVANVGEEHIWELMKIRECDRVGMRKIESPYRLRKYHAMIEEVLRDPISVGQLVVNGKYMIEKLGITPGPRMGWILNALLEAVLDNPEKNTIPILEELIKQYETLGDSELRILGEKGKEKKDKLETEELKKLQKKYKV